MPPPDGDGDPIGHGADELLRALGALRARQARFLADAHAVCQAREPAFAAILHRWEEDLAAIQLQVLRVEGRLRHWLDLPERPHDSGAHGPARSRRAGHWRPRLGAWLVPLHVDTAYRRIEEPLDPDAEAVTADILTDLALLLEAMESTMPALEDLQADRSPSSLEERSFYGVVAPWRRLGRRPLSEVLRWLAEYLAAEGDW